MSRRQRDRKAKRLRHSRGGRVAMGATVALGAAFVAPAVSQANAPIVVTSNADTTDPGTLRHAITQANGDAAADTITFDSSLSGSHIDLGSTLPEITKPLTISGPGASNLTINGPTNGQILYAYMATSGDALTVSGLTLAGGHGDTASGNIQSGGAIAAKYTDLTVDHSVVSGSQGAIGGGIFVEGGTARVTDSTIANNTATLSSGRGGGIANAGSTLTVTRSEITGNQATGTNATGGGIAEAPASSNNPTTTINDSLIADNTAAKNGGGLALPHATGDTNTDAINNSTIFHNHSTGGYGGGIYSGTTQGNTVKPIAIDSSTVAFNDAAHGGGGIEVQAVSGSGSYVPGATINNTIVAQNSATSGEQDIARDTQIDPIAAAFTLVQHAPGAGVMNESVAGSNILGADPNLGGLASNGGPTRTLALNSGSPAIDKGATALTADQRGSARPSDDPNIPNSTAAGANGADIGAFEVKFVPPPPQPVVPALPASPFGKLSTSSIKTGPNSVSIVLTCASANCDGLLNLFTTEKLNGNKVVGLSKKKARKKRIKVGSKAYHLTAGQKKRITVKLNSKGTKLLKKFGRVPVKLVVTQKQLNGKSVTIKNARVTIKVKKKKRK